MIDPWEVARNVAGWLMGQDRKKALEYVQRMKDQYDAENRESAGCSEGIPVSGSESRLEESAEGEQG